MRIGILGGSFDPIHNGHLKLARAALSQCKLARVFFVVSPRSPFKLHVPQTLPLVRYQMVRLAVRGHRKFEVADWELKRKGPSYTVATLRAYKKRYPSHQIYLIMGSDIFRGLNRWKNPEEIRRLSTIVIGRRPGSKKPNLSASNLMLKGVFPDISSTRLRDRIAKGKNVGNWMKPAVQKYIKRVNLYG